MDDAIPSRQMAPLVPEMTYEGMVVSNGEQAGLAWEKMVRGNLSRVE